MRQIHTLIFTVVLVVAMTLSAAAGEKPLVVFANPGAHGDAFFQPMTEFMRAAADDLGFELDVYYGDRNHVLIDENLLAIFKRDPLPDYVIGMDARDSGKTLLDLSEATGVKTIFINQSFLGETRKELGGPGEKYKSWLFEYLPDDVQSGYLLARTLIEKASAMGLADQDGIIHIQAINGLENSAASSLRKQGLMQAINEYPQTRLHQTIYADWKRDRARELAKGLLERYPKTTIIWSASDKMALGVCEGIREFGKEPGKDVLTGGVDWASISLGMVETGDFTISVGGHFMDGAWALVMLYDLIHGSDLPRPKKSFFSGITAKNIQSYKTHFYSGNWHRIDFTRFSKYANPDLKRYEFGLAPVLSQLEKQ